MDRVGGYRGNCRERRRDGCGGGRERGGAVSEAAVGPLERRQLHWRALQVAQLRLLAQRFRRELNGRAARVRSSVLMHLDGDRVVRFLRLLLGTHHAPPPYLEQPIESHNLEAHPRRFLQPSLGPHSQ